MRLSTSLSRPCCLRCMYLPLPLAQCVRILLRNDGSDRSQHRLSMSAGEETTTSMTSTPRFCNLSSFFRLGLGWGLWTITSLIRTGRFSGPNSVRSGTTPPNLIPFRIRNLYLCHAFQQVA